MIITLHIVESKKRTKFKNVNKNKKKRQMYWKNVGSVFRTTKINFF